MQPLTNYEAEQVRHIAGWKAERPNLLGEAFEKLTQPLVELTEELIPPNAIKESINNAYMASEVFAGKDAILEKAGVGELQQLRDKDLALSDQLVDEVIGKAAESAFFRGASSGAGGVVSTTLNIPVMISHALSTIHKIGYCYGYSVHEPHEKHYVLGIMLISAADSPEKKQHAVVNLRRVEDMLIDEALEELAEEAVADVIIESGGLTSIPGFGIIAGAVSDAAFAEHVGEVAKFCFQERWLRANEKVTQIAPDASQARSNLQRVTAGISFGAYWTCYTLSFAVSYPTLLLVSFIPADNAMVGGLGDGRDAAREDVQKLRDRVRSQFQPSELPAPAVGVEPAVAG